MIIYYNPAVTITSIKIIGYKHATYPNDFKFQMSTDSATPPIDIIEPEEFYTTNIDEFATTAFIVCVFKNLTERKNLIDYIKLHNLNKCSFIHNSTCINLATITVSPGTFIMQYCVVAHEAVIGEDCLITPYTLISHRVRIGNSVNVCPNSLINGSVTIVDYTYIGSRSTLRDNVNIPANTYVGMMSTVNKDIELIGTYLGSPCRKVSDDTVFDHFNFV